MGTADGTAPQPVTSAESRQQEAGQPALASLGLGPGPNSVHRAAGRERHWYQGKAGEGGDVGEPGLPLPQPGPLRQRPGAQEARASLSQLAGGPLAILPCCGSCWASVFLRGSLSPLIQTQLLGGGSCPISSFSRKGKNPEPSQCLPGLEPSFRLHTNFFPKKGQLAWLLAGGRGDSAGNRWGQGLTSGLWHNLWLRATSHTGGAATFPMAETFPTNRRPAGARSCIPAPSGPHWLPDDLPEAAWPAQETSRSGPYNTIGVLAGPPCCVARRFLNFLGLGRPRQDQGQLSTQGTPLPEPHAPSTLRASQAWPTASQGDGMSRKTASASWLTPKPLRHTSWLRTVTQRPTRCSWNSCRAFSARCWWNSTVCRWPVGAMVRMMAWDTEPLPVPGGQDGYQAGLLGRPRNQPKSPE